MGVSSSKPLDIASKWFPEFEKNLPSLEGKTVCITGCTSGTGYIVARTAIRKNASNVVLLNRSSSRATKAEELLKEELKASSSCSNVETISCDLQDFESVKAAASAIKSKFESVDVLCNNAGIMALEDKATKDGYDIQIQTNHLSHFLLTNELFPLLKIAAETKGDARVCNHSSVARYGKDLESKYFEKNGGNLGGNGSSVILGGARWVRYQQSKLANSVFSSAMTDRVDNISGFKSVCAHPGLSATNLQTTTAQDGGMGSVGLWFMRMAQSQEDGSMPIIAACFDPSTTNGSFWGPSLRQQFIGPAKMFEYDKPSLNQASKNMLWEKSEAACSEFKI
eukprot:CAMPEP_0113301888 /NCGR_PEP_ID=MMETSP0010_2-20120614/2924_1 /TAXON_ID=216773 ORGANISM="Corethron hystrix, Strain 308" /NCGR_SAMPLE_ID=MMETSP0010_2 /ASSEMBLY_ACC=CAM_ASM_000155 /LENGTH=337 /DNA_ID=CAMNT_0000155575 /DNA_START=6 /DNA_END=1019 /DNA_ORIENTATION=+ /assembly_acc=CAM_ASM_000155